MMREYRGFKAIRYKKDIVANIYIADTFTKRFLGYMFRKKPHYEAILIRPCNSIHTFFMKFNIDVLFVYEEMKVIKKHEGLKPNKIIAPVKGASMVIEATEGSFKKIAEGRFVDLA